MSTKYLGNHFDIHTGGVDLKFPHHENEIAQSEGCFDEKFVNYWLHCEHLLVDGEKMSKSKGNFYILKDVLDKGYAPKAIRYLLLSTHYRQNLNFTFEALGSAENVIKKFKEFLMKLKLVELKNDNHEVSEIIAKAKSEFEAAMDDDLNISGGLAAIFDFMTSANKLLAEDNLSRNDALKCFDRMMEFDKVLGMLEFKDEKIPDEVMALVTKRDAARAEKNWPESDRIREQLKEMGYAVDDSGKGSLVKKI